MASNKITRNDGEHNYDGKAKPSLRISTSAETLPTWRHHLDRPVEIRRSRSNVTLDQCFRHIPLEHANSKVRLFKFLPTTTYSEIRLTLHTWRFEVWRKENYDPRMNSCPRYSAISYVWGDATRCQSILINGKAFWITANAMYALRQVHHQLAIKELSTVYFWMDLICINQDSLDEKAKQVQLMGDIYEHAIEVIACVGAHKNNSELLVNILREVDLAASFYKPRPFEMKRTFGWEGHLRLKPGSSHRTGDPNADYARDRLRFYDVLANKSDLLPGHLNLPLAEFVGIFDLAVGNFANREYWWRVWIVQELQLSKYVKILCGFDSLKLEHIAPLTRLFVRQEDAPGLPSLVNLEKSKMGLVLLSTLRYVNFRQYRANWSALEAFRDLRNSRCTDFRDRVYAYLGISDWIALCDNPKIIPNYQITKAGLLFEVANEIAFNRPDFKCQTTGQLVWEILVALYQTLQLTAADHEISNLIDARRCGREQSHVGAASSALTPLDPFAAHNLLEWHTYSFRLESSASQDGLEVNGPFNSFEPTLPVHFLNPSELRYMQLKASNAVIGWVCPDAQPGDFLLGVDLDGPVPDDIQVIVRSTPGDGFRIIGHAVVHNHIPIPHKHFPGEYQHPSRQLKDNPDNPEVQLRFEVQDYIALIAMRMDLVREDFSDSDLMRLLSLPVTRSDSSSFGILRERITSRN